MSRQPYPGLRPFEQDEADIFFGREEHIDQLIDRLGQFHFLALVGPSGCGKSSLIRAGLIPAMGMGYLASAGTQWAFVTMRPGSPHNDPFQNLVEKLLKFSHLQGLYDAVTLKEKLVESRPLSLCKLLREHPLPPNTSLFILVDQFEEIFRYRDSIDTNEAMAFVNLLLVTAQEARRKEGALPVYIVMTMRTDFLGDCTVFQGLPEEINASQFLTPRLNTEQRMAAITEPAAVYEGEIQEALMNRLLDDMGAEPDQLPVMQHLLMRMWRLKQAKLGETARIVLTLADYQALGGWKDGLSRHADEAYNEFDDKQKRLAESLFRCLTERGPEKRDIRRPIRLETIAAVAGVSVAELMPVIDCFRQPGRSFLTPPAEVQLKPDTTIDISHESLIRQWDRLKGWVELEAKSASRYQRMEDDAILWEQGLAEPWEGLDLAPVITWQALTKPTEAWAKLYGREQFGLTMQFLQYSIRRDWIKKWLQRVAVAGIFVTAVTMYVLWQNAQKALELAEKNAQEAAEATQTAVVATQKSQAWGLTADTDFLRDQSTNDALLTAYLTAEAVQRAKALHFEKEKNNFKPVVEQAMRSDLTLLASHPEPYAQALAQPDPIALLNILDVAWVNKIKGQHKHSGEITQIIKSPDGQYLAATLSGNDTVAQVWSVKTQKLSLNLAHRATVNAIAFSPNGQYVVTGGDDHAAIVWRLANKQIENQLNHAGRVTHLAFSPDGRYVVTASELKNPKGKSEEYRAMVWDFATQQPAIPLPHRQRIKAVGFSKDSKTVLTTTEEGVSQQWSLENRAALQLAHTAQVNKIAFSPDGQYVVTAGKDNAARIWEVSTGKQIKVLAHQGNVNAVAVSADGQFVASASDDRKAQVWNLKRWHDWQEDWKPRFFTHKEQVTTLAFSPDSHYLVTGSLDNTARIFDMSNVRQNQALLQLGNPKHSGVSDVVFSPDGRFLATGHDNGWVYFWDGQAGWDKTIPKQPLLAVAAHPDRINKLSFSHDWHYLATASKDTFGRLWALSFSDVSGAIVQADLVKEVLHDGWVNAVAISADSRYFATASEDGEACVWAIKNAKMRCIDQHLGRVKALAFSPDSHYLATASGDETARVWALDDNASKAYQEVSRIKHDDAVNDVAFSSDGRKVATAASDHTAWVTVWQDLDKEVCSRLTVDDNLLKKAKHYLPDESFLDKLIGKARTLLALPKSAPACVGVKEVNK